MAKNYAGELIAKGLKFGIVVSRFNETISQRLIDGCLDMLLRHRAEEEKIEIFWVPGGFEIPYLANILAQSKKYDAIICLGAIIRGETPHFDYIATQVSKAISQISLETKVPVIFGVLTTDTMEQAIDRSGGKMGNEGAQAGLSAIELVNLISLLK